MRVYADTTLTAVNTWTPIERYELEFPLEGPWQRMVESFFREDMGFMCYHTWNSKGSGKGFPDLWVAHPDSGYMVAAELKVENPKKRKVTPEQLDWLQASAACGTLAFVWRPSEVDEVRDIVQEIVNIGRRAKGLPTA